MVGALPGDGDPVERAVMREPEEPAEDVRAHGPALTRRALVALAAAGALETGVVAAHAASLRDLHRSVERHPLLREADGSPIWFVDAAKFQNWGRTVRNTPAVTFVPRTKHGVSEIVRWARANGKTVR